MVAVGLAVLLGACATRGGVDNNALIMEQLGVFKAGMESKNIDQIMAGISDNFSHYEWGDKATLEGFVQDTFNQSDLDNAEVTLDDAEITIDEEGVATVYPVDLVAMFGSGTIEFTMKKEADGCWRVVGMDVEGI